MSVSCGIAWLGDVPDLFPMDDATTLVRSGFLDRQPGAGLRSLSSFFSVSPEEARAEYESLAGENGELPAIEFPPEEFFPPADGLATVRAHLAYLTAHPTEVRNTPELVADLQDMERVLAALVAAGVPFHVTIIP